MEISGIRSSMPFVFGGAEKEATTINPQKDVIDIHQPELIPDEEVETVFQDTLRMIGEDAATALGIHSGLSESRVFALLGA